MSSIGFDTLVCLNCGTIGERPSGKYLSCCPERKTITIREVDALIKNVRELEVCQCGMCTSQIRHLSSCAVHNAPATKPGPCDCGAEETWREKRFKEA